MLNSLCIAYNIDVIFIPKFVSSFLSEIKKMNVSVLIDVIDQNWVGCNGDLDLQGFHFE